MIYSPGEGGSFYVKINTPVPHISMVLWDQIS